MNKERIWLSLAHMGGEEQRFVKEVFDKKYLGDKYNKRYY